MDMLSKPTDVFPLQTKEKRPIAVTCMTFDDNEYNGFLVGGEDGYIYKGNRLEVRAGIKCIYEQHDAPITGISKFSTPESKFNNLFLTSYIDSTIKLWSLDDEKPLHTINNNYEYVMDIAWSPTNPALFGTVNESGHLDLWNMNMDTEEPIISTMLNGQPALNRISWLYSGKHIAIGDIDGKLHIYDIDESLTHPVYDENTGLCETLDMLKQKRLLN
ncbi:cytoplasmic dynein 1 intermediate chain-like [Musca vetustissima]|uniref:cytoplasmic dynein 1 intermediate chain-like n=1 Tax=Musca vetustissima TaxID=27455 RepID=UPI002AB69470|nr:cytoplasmic dynein 1 intermediate chain-like [Musca vetustissima]